MKHRAASRQRPGSWAPDVGEEARTLTPKGHSRSAWTALPRQPAAMQGWLWSAGYGVTFL